MVIRLRRSALGYRSGGSLELTAAALPAVTRAPGRSGEFMGSPCRLNVQVRPDVAPPAETEDTPELRAMLDQDPVFGIARVFKPAPRTGKPDTWGGSLAGELPEFFPEIARAYGVDLIASAYWSAPSVKPRSLSDARPIALHALLRRLAGSYYAVDRRDRLVRLRSRSWFLDRPREIPLRVVRRWEQLFKEHGALPLPELASSFARLTHDQFESLYAYREGSGYPTEVDGLAYMPAQRQALRLYAALTPDQQQRLQRGELIPAQRMGAAARRLFLSFFEERSLQNARSPQIDDLTGAGLYVTAEPRVIVREQRGETVSYRRLAPDEPEAAARPAGAAGKRPGGGPMVTRHPASAVRFRFRCGGAEDHAVFVVAAPR